MSDLSIRPARREELDRIAELAAGFGREPTSRSLMLGTTTKEVRGELTAFTEHPEWWIRVALRDQEIIGLIGCDYADEQRRAWLWGPLTAADGWDEIASPLFRRLLADLPAGTRVDTFTHAANVRAHELALALGFREEGRVFVYMATRPEPLSEVVAPCAVLANADHPSFVELHDATFPRTTMTGRQVLEQLAGEHRVFATVNDGTVTGYCHAAREDGGPNGYIHFLGVRDSHRRRGLGRRLLQTAVGWAFRELDAPRVSLTVEEGRSNARALYESAGFELEVEGRTGRLDAI